ncbi:hypothetical protein AAA799P11_00137 [Marine Group I thaumarchaeote SCGC AAA799-P11]|uniref:Uncharacterized protein n=1 Tax=Marine Group I thaumarchaeote SCGC AAA799-P11 TaxID=1502295 RepID=A0A087S3T6_9ARCH|nr:hypothetical protein AAA799P11_00137 [Marine Group I thaumarchaeote SCGC AAA799-P11]
MILDNSKLNVYVFEDAIVVKNNKDFTKQFPRCGITQIESFVLDMAKRGKLDDLLC